MNLNNFIQRIQYSGKIDVSKETLFFLHRAHVLNVPFENFHVINKIPIVLDQANFYAKIVENRRGGFCYELNGLFARALEEIGFNYHFISCSVFVPALQEFRSNFGHLAIIVILKEKKYLVDVGFGDAFIEPLEIQFDEPKFQFGAYYKFKETSEGEILLEKSLDNEVYQKMYRFSLKKKRLQDFTEACNFHQSSPLAPFTKQPLCSRATSAGRITLTSTSLIITNAQQKKETPVTSPAHFEELLEELFGMKFVPDQDMVV